MEARTQRHANEQRAKRWIVNRPVNKRQQEICPDQIRERRIRQESIRETDGSDRYEIEATV